MFPRFGTWKSKLLSPKENEEERQINQGVEEVMTDINFLLRKRKIIQVCHFLL
jgi:hypothetical protein